MGQVTTHREYGHRDVLDKLGLRPGHTVVLNQEAWQFDLTFADRVLERAGRTADTAIEPVDVVLVAVDNRTDAIAVLLHWRSRLAPAGGIWLLTPKRGQPGYVDQRLLIEAGKQSGVVDNKVCSISDTVSGMRFVIRKADRLPARSP